MGVNRHCCRVKSGNTTPVTYRLANIGYKHKEANKETLEERPAVAVPWVKRVTLTSFEPPTPPGLGLVSHSYLMPVPC